MSRQSANHDEQHERFEKFAAAKTRLFTTGQLKPSISNDLPGGGISKIVFSFSLTQLGLSSRRRTAIAFDKPDDFRGIQQIRTNAIRTIQHEF